MVTDIPTLFWLFCLCSFFEQKARKVKGEVVTPLFFVLFVIPRLASHSTLCLSAPSPSALFLLPLLPSKTWVFGWGLLWLFFFCFFSHLDSADWLLITLPYLLRGNDSVFFSPQLKHYRQTHSFIIWGGTASIPLKPAETMFSAAPRCRSSVALLFSGTDGATDIRKLWNLFSDTWKHH